MASVGALLDAGALLLSARSASTWTGDTDRGSTRGPMLVLAYGVPTLVEIGRAAGLPIDPPVPLVELATRRRPAPPPEISVTREEYEAALDRLRRHLPVPRRGPRGGWHRFAWVRSSYDRAAARPGRPHPWPRPAPWTTDRPAGGGPAPAASPTDRSGSDWSLPARRRPSAPDPADAGGRPAYRWLKPPGLLLGHGHRHRVLVEVARWPRLMSSSSRKARSRLTPWRTRIRWTEMSDTEPVSG